MNREFERELRDSLYMEQKLFSELKPVSAYRAFPLYPRKVMTAPSRKKTARQIFTAEEADIRLK